MIDIALNFNSDRFDFDLSLQWDGVNGDLEGDQGLLTAVIISLFSDRRANDDDPLPDERVGLPSDLRGWWGDLLEDDAPYAENALGSRLWLLWREKDMDSVVARARQYAEESLQWLIRDGRVSGLHVTASRVSKGYLGISVQALPVPGANEKSREWNFVYDYVNARPLSISAPGL